MYWVVRFHVFCVGRCTGTPITALQMFIIFMFSYLFKYNQLSCTSHFNLNYINPTSSWIDHGGSKTPTTLFHFPTNVTQFSVQYYVMTSKHCHLSEWFVNECILILASHNWLKMYGFSDVNLLSSQPCTALHLRSEANCCDTYNKAFPDSHSLLNKTKCILKPITGHVTLKVLWNVQEQS